MLRADVVEAGRAGQFHVWAVATVDEGIELLTGLARRRARRATGASPRAASTGAVDDRLAAFAEKARSFARAGDREPRPRGRRRGRAREPRSACAGDPARPRPHPRRLPAPHGRLGHAPGPASGSASRACRPSPGSRCASRWRGRSCSSSPGGWRCGSAAAGASGSCGRERRPVLLRLLLGRLLVRAVHPLRADGRACSPRTRCSWPRSPTSSCRESGCAGPALLACCSASRGSP